jgi:hypothetical protein|tara:strand:+ start:789 stop:1589 length:801 start_codon:yes stop_codon:yes gene_type:complete
MSNLVSTKEIDYLDEDKPIRNQNFCLLSFITPQDVLKNKETYYIKYFLKKFSNDIESLFNGLLTKYPDEKKFINNIKNDHEYLFNVEHLDEQYKYSKIVNSEVVEKQFHEDNDFQTTISGIKVRGVFDTIQEAKNRSEFLKKIDKNHNIFIGQVGCWCPFSPNPEDLENQEYSETQLNTLMKEYKKNQETKDEVFEKRKQNSIEKNKIIEEESNMEQDIEQDTEKDTSNDITIENNDDDDIQNRMENLDTVFNKDDPWTQQKNLFH